MDDRDLLILVRFASLLLQKRLGDGAATGIESMLAELPHLNERKQIWEDNWRTSERTDAEAILSVLVKAARYVSDLVQGDVPFLAPRELAAASVGLPDSAGAEALMIGTAVQRSIRRQLVRQSEQLASAVVEQMQQVLDRWTSRVLPPISPQSRFLNTKQIAVRLGISEITAARLCRRGLIDADKTRGNQWRTTESRLLRSRYLRTTG